MPRRDTRKQRAQAQQASALAVGSSVRYGVLALLIALAAVLCNVRSVSPSASSQRPQPQPQPQRPRGDLLGAVSKGDAAAAAAILDSGASVDATTPDGWSALHLAAQHGHATSALVLLERGARVDASAQAGWTPLHLSAGVGHADLIAPLLKHGASPSATNADGFNALHLAAQFGHAAVLSALAEAGALAGAGGVVDSTTADGATALHLAAERGHTSVVERLLAHGAATGFLEFRPPPPISPICRPPLFPYLTFESGFFKCLVPHLEWLSYQRDDVELTVRELPPTDVWPLLPRALQV